MSVEAIAWALKQPIKPSAAKFVLVAMADCVNRDTFIAWPSIAALIEATCQDRKTIFANIARLRNLGYIEDTGERKGVTGQIIVYRLKDPVNGTVDVEPEGPKESHISPEIESQERNSTESGTVPDITSKGTVFPPKESHISPERVPYTGHGTGIGTGIGTGREPEKKARAKRPPPIDGLRPEGVTDSVWRDFLATRKAHKAPVTETAMRGIAREAEKAGLTIAQALVICCERSWRGFNAGWLETPRRGAPAGRESTEEHNRRAAAEFLRMTDGRTIDA